MLTIVIENESVVHTIKVKLDLANFLSKIAYFVATWRNRPFEVTTKNIYYSRLKLNMGNAVPVLDPSIPRTSKAFGLNLSVPNIYLNISYIPLNFILYLFLQCFQGKFLISFSCELLHALDKFGAVNNLFIPLFQCISENTEKDR